MTKLASVVDGGIFANAKIAFMRAVQSEIKYFFETLLGLRIEDNEYSYNYSARADGKVNSIPIKYLERLSDILYRSELYYDEASKRVVPFLNVALITNFFDGNERSFSRMYYIEHGAKPKQGYFFFSIHNQKQFIEMKSRVSKRQGFIAEGKYGAGVLANFMNFSETDKSLLRRLYKKSKNEVLSYPGYDGIGAQEIFINYFSNGEFVDKLNFLPQIEEALQFILGEKGKIKFVPYKYTPVVKKNEIGVRIKFKQVVNNKVQKYRQKTIYSKEAYKDAINLIKSIFRRSFYGK